jgi:hypothetical protein
VRAVVPDEETLDSLLVGEEAKLELLLLVEQADAQQVVPELSAEPSLVLGAMEQMKMATCNSEAPWVQRS